jgi:hypothetical protein
MFLEPFNQPLAYILMAGLLLSEVVEREVLKESFIEVGRWRLAPWKCSAAPP